MAYKVIILYRLYMPSYFLGTFTEYPSLQAMPVVVQVTFVNILLKMTCWKQLWLCQKKTSTIQVLVHLYGL